MRSCAKTGWGGLNGADTITQKIGCEVGTAVAQAARRGSCAG
jgi:hypothetical protein